ncbi:MAG: ATP-grasp fold amidoligase family protein, partial [Lachnospiraceae bacterium]
MGKEFFVEKWKEKKKDHGMLQLRENMVKDGFEETVIERWISETEEHFKNNSKFDFTTCFWAYERGFLPEYVDKFQITDENRSTFLTQPEYYALMPMNGAFGKKLRNQRQIRTELESFSEFFPEIYAYIIVGKEEFQPYVAGKKAELESVLDLIREKKDVIVRSNYYTQKEFFRVVTYEDKRGFRIGGEEISEDELKHTFQERSSSMIFTEHTSWHSMLERYVVTRSKIQMILHRKTSAHAVLDLAYLRVNPGNVAPIHVQTGYCELNPIEGISFTIPNWEKIAAKVEEICSKMRQAKLLQVNLVVTEHSFQIVSFESDIPFWQDKLFTSEMIGTLKERLCIDKANREYPEENFTSILQVNYYKRDEMGRRERRAYVEEYFSNYLGYVPDLDHPKTFNEKISWYKLYYENPLVTQCCDKYAVKAYVEERIGKEYIVPTIATYKTPEEINYDALPDQFALKVNWSSGFNIIVPDKAALDQEQAGRKLKRWIQPYNNSYYHSFNWGYKDMEPVIYAEEYLEQPNGLVDDYKFFCCNGKVEFLFVAIDRFGENRLSYNFRDRDFQPYPFYWGGRTHTSKKLERPENFEKMIEVAQKLAEPFPFVRVDLYQVAGQLYVGEMTFYSGGGRNRVEPKDWDLKLGKKI